MTYANKNKYDGFWQYDKYHGQGKFTWNSGDTYEGEYNLVIIM